MRELSLHILDIVQNSITANANLIVIEINEDLINNKLEFAIADNGKGMSPEFLENVCDPFATTRTTRRVGLGLSLLKAAAEQCGGGLNITSELGMGTEVTVWFIHDHIDRVPLGKIDETVLMLITCNPKIDFIYTHTVNDNEFKMDSREIKKIIEGVEITNHDVVLWMKDYLKQGINSLYGGV